MRLFVLLLLAAAFSRPLLAAASSDVRVTDGLAVIVNDAVITYQDVEEYIFQAVELLKSQYRNQPELLRERVAAARADGTEQLVERQLILYEFKTAGYNFPESIIEDIIRERVRAQYGDRLTLTKTLRQQGITYESYRQRTRDEIIVSQMRLKNVSQETLISPHKIQTFYESYKTNWAVGEEVKVRMIVLNKPQSDSGGTKKLGEEILQKIGEGASFEDMAKIHSDGPQRATGGDYGWRERSFFRPELADVAFSLKPGQRSGVIDTPDSCWLIQVEEKRPARVKPLSEVREEIDRTLIVQERNRLQKKWIDKLRAKSFVRYF